MSQRKYYKTHAHDIFIYEYLNPESIQYTIGNIFKIDNLLCVRITD